MNRFAPTVVRGGSVIEARSSRVRGSFTSSRGPCTPTQMVTIRPRESNVTEAQSAVSRIEFTASRPSGPAPR